MAERRWGVFWVCVVTALAALSMARAADNAAQGSDFLVLAIKPEGDVKDYRMVPIGEGTVDPVQYRDVVKSLPRSLFGGVIVRPHDERAELAQCRTACAANAKCGNFTYVRPGKERPVGVCHLRRAVEQASNTVAMPPVVENAAPAPEVVVVSPIVRNDRKLIAIDSTRNGRSLYTPDQAPLAPVTFRFKAPVATAKADVRTMVKDRIWANIEALDANGRVFKRSGTWIAADGAAHQVLVRTESNRIGAVRITARDPGALRVDGIDFVRAAPLVAEAPPEEDTNPSEEAGANIPPPAPELVAEAFPIPPRPVATEPPADIVQPPEEQAAPEPQTEVTVAELPANSSEDAVITIPIAPAEAAAPTPAEPGATPSAQPLPEVPVLAAFGAAALLLGGTGLYRQNYRRRTLARLTTNILTDGRERPAVTLDAEEPDMSLRFTVRAHATVSARQTEITITPDGTAA
ncbi:MAG: hypothetical protein ACKVRO_06520 [Micropepsaceae bacterium]